MTLVYVTLAFVAGMALADIVPVPAVALGLLAIWGACIALLEWPHPIRRQAALLALIALLGCWRWQLAQPVARPGDLSFYNETGALQIEGYISADPVLRETRQQIELTAETVTLLGQTAQVQGAVLITIQNHLNTIAVCTLAGISVIVICHARPIPDDMLAAANREHVAIVTTPLSQFACSVALAALPPSVRS